MLRIERTFLIDKLPENYNQCRSSKIRQCYLVESADACRIREKDGAYTITRKLFTRPGDLSHREYEDFPITQEEFEILWGAAKSRLEKNRYYYASTIAYQLRIDEFLGSLEGLYLVEMVFVNDGGQGGIDELDWLGKEITNEPWAYNQYLSTKSYDDIRHLIGPFESNIGHSEADSQGGL